MFPQISYIQSSEVSFVCIISILRFLNSKNKNVRYFVIYFAARTLKSSSIPFLCFYLFSKLGIFCHLISCLLSNLYFAIKPINRNFYLVLVYYHIIEINFKSHLCSEWKGRSLDILTLLFYLAVFVFNVYVIVFTFLV